MAKEKEDLWVAWTHDALRSYSEPDKIDSVDDLIDDMAETACKYADAMVEEFEERFSGGNRRRRSKKTDPEDDPEND